MVDFQQSNQSTPADIIRTARKQFKIFHQTPLENRGEIGRGLLDSRARAFPETYSKSLPTLEGKDVGSLIEEMIGRNEKNARESNAPYIAPTFVDVGYGAGYFLLEAEKEWGKKVSWIGYGPSLDTKITYLGNPPTKPALDQAGIELIEGNIIDIDKWIRDADAITASNVVQWAMYPHWELVKKLYRIIAKGGFGLINSCGLDTMGDFDLEKILTQNGYKFEPNRGGYGNVAFRKTNERITIPVVGIMPSNSSNDPIKADFGRIRLAKK